MMCLISSVMVSVDDILSLLHEKRRRYVLYYLDKQDEPVHVNEVAEAVAETETNSELTDGPGQRFESIRLSIHHNHLQKADIFEFITYNSCEGTVEMIQSPSKFDTLLTVAEVLEQPEE
jgi:hypothetical protein